MIRDSKKNIQKLTLFNSNFKYINYQGKSITAMKLKAINHYQHNNKKK